MSSPQYRIGWLVRFVQRPVIGRKDEYAGQTGIITQVHDRSRESMPAYEVTIADGTPVWTWEDGIELAEPQPDYRALAIELLGRYEAALEGLIDEAGIYGETEAELRAEVTHYKEVLGINE